MQPRWLVVVGTLQHQPPQPFAFRIAVQDCLSYFGKQITFKGSADCLCSETMVIVCISGTACGGGSRHHHLHHSNLDGPRMFSALRLPNSRRGHLVPRMLAK